MSQAVFAYGSLVSAESAAATLSRAVEPIAPAALGGWRRRWSLCRDNLRSEKSFALEPGGELPPYVLGLNLEPGETEAGPANGALLDVSEPELARLDQRELRYDRVDVTDQLEASERFDRVWTFTAKPEHHASEPPRGAVILTTYASAVEDAFAALGKDELARYRATTGPPPVDIVEARLVEDRIPPGNPRRW